MISYRKKNYQKYWNPVGKLDFINIFPSPFQVIILTTLLSLSVLWYTPPPPQPCAPNLSWLQIKGGIIRELCVINLPPKCDEICVRLVFCEIMDPSVEPLCPHPSGNILSMLSPFKPPPWLACLKHDFLFLFVRNYCVVYFFLQFWKYNSYALHVEVGINGTYLGWTERHRVCLC